MISVSETMKNLIPTTLIVAVLIVGEVGLRVHHKMEAKTPRYIPHHYLNYRLNPEYEGHNSLGFRGEEIGEKLGLRIVTLGGSTTYATGVKDYRDSYSYLLGKKLGVEGTSNSAHLVAMMSARCISCCSSMASSPAGT